MCEAAAASKEPVRLSVRIDEKTSAILKLERLVALLAKAFAQALANATTTGIAIRLEKAVVGPRTTQHRRTIRQHLKAEGDAGGAAIGGAGDYSLPIDETAELIAVD